MAGYKNDINYSGLTPEAGSFGPKGPGGAMYDDHEVAAINGRSSNGMPDGYGLGAQRNVDTGSGWKGRGGYRISESRPAEDYTPPGGWGLGHGQGVSSGSGEAE